MISPPRSDFVAPPQGGAASGPAEPAPRRPLGEGTLAQKRGLLLGVRGWTAVIAALAVLTVLIPLLNRVVPADSAFHLSDYAVGLTGKILCYAICALAMDLIWVTAWPQPALPQEPCLARRAFPVLRCEGTEDLHRAGPEA